MGCGGSKEKAAPVEDKPQPIKKIRTNFSDVHYDEPASGRRDTVYAPSEMPESRRPTEIPEEGAPPMPKSESTSAAPAQPATEAAPITTGDGVLSPGSPGTPLPSQEGKTIA